MIPRMPHKHRDREIEELSQRRRGAREGPCTCASCKQGLTSCVFSAPAESVGENGSFSAYGCPHLHAQTSDKTCAGESRRNPLWVSTEGRSQGQHRFGSVPCSLSSRAYRGDRNMGRTLPSTPAVTAIRLPSRRGSIHHCNGFCRRVTKNITLQPQLLKPSHDQTQERDGEVGLHHRPAGLMLPRTDLSW